jgi:hypothetical protein
LDYKKASVALYIIGVLIGIVGITLYGWVSAQFWWLLIVALVFELVGGGLGRSARNQDKYRVAQELARSRRSNDTE